MLLQVAVEGPEPQASMQVKLIVEQPVMAALE